MGMRNLLTLIAVLLISAPAFAGYNLSNSDYTSPYADDAWTLALWHMDQTSGDTAALDSAAKFDSHDTPHRHDMVLYQGLNDGWNSPAKMELDPTQTWVASMTGFGNAAYSYYVDKQDSNIGPMRAEDPFATIGDLSSGDHTFEWWMNPSNAGGGWGSRILKHYTGGPWNFNYQGGVLSMGWWGAGGWQSFSDTTTITQNTWTHVAVTIDNSSDTDTSLLTWWYNGVNANSIRTDPPNRILSSPASTFAVMFNDGFGTLYSARQYMGMLDEVRISNTMRFIPEPASLSLLALGLLALRRRKK
jgi:hypothetical protein